MQEIQDIKDRFQPHSQNPEQEQETGQIHSQYLKECKEFYGLNSEESFSKMQGQLIEAIRAHNITYDTQQQFSEQTLVRISNHSNNYEVVEVDVKLGYFTFKNISIVNIDTLFPYHLTNQEGCGSFGTVFQAYFHEEPIAIKASFFKKEKSERIVPQEVGSTIKMLLRQFCLSKIASIIGVGPAISSQTGFDLMIYNDCVAYAMEYCQNQNYSQPFALSRNKLQSKLLSLHALKFIHMDIKEDNICYSKIKKDYVFIDYGLSKIIKEDIGRKSLTHFFGTASHCSEEMGLLISHFKEDYVDLYYNDICCLNSSLQSDKEYWKNNKKYGGVDRVRPKVDPKPMEKYEKTIIVLYLKFMLYKFKVERFRIVFKKHFHSLKKVEIEQILAFIEGFSFSSSLFLVLREFSEAIKHDAFDNSNPELFLSDNSIQFFQYNFDILEKINSTEEKKKVKTIKDAVKEREMLNQMSIVQRMNWKVYIKLLIDSIQINKNICSYKQKSQLCDTAKKLLMKGYVPDLVLYEQRPIVLEQVSESLFRFSISQPINKTKIEIFHSIIYNIVLLHIVELQEIYEIYKTILHLPLNISDRARMQLKIKTTLFFRQLEVNTSYVERIAINDRLSSLDEQYYESETHLKEPERQFLKAANMSYFHMQTKSNLAQVKHYYQKIITQNAYREYIKDDIFARQIQLSLELPPEKVAIFQGIIFPQMNNLYISFQYFHLILFALSELIIRHHNSAWIANLFQQIFKETIVLDNYYLNIITYIVDLKKSYYCDYETFIFRIKNNIDLKRVKPTSYFGRKLKIQMHQLLLNKKVQKLSQEIRSFYIQNRHFLVSYDYDMPQKQVQKCFIYHIQTFFMEDFYGFKFYDNANEVNDRNFQMVYRNCRQKVMKMSMRHKNTGIILLLMLASYIFYRRKALKQVTEIFKITVVMLPLLQSYDHAFLNLKLRLMQFYFRLAVSYTFKTNRIKQSMLIYYHFNEIIEQKSAYHLLLQRQNSFCQLYLFLICEYPEKVPSLINKLSKTVMVHNQTHIGTLYYSILDQLIRLPNFVLKLMQANKSIVNSLEDTRINPYNGVYLHHMMCFKDLWSHRIFLQICRVFNFLPKNIVNQIRQNYFKYVYAYYPTQAYRQKCYFERLIMKYSSNYDMTPSKLFLIMIPRNSFSLLQQQRNIEKLKLIKQKLIRYNMSYKSEKIYTKYSLICRQEQYSRSRIANLLRRN